MTVSLVVAMKASFGRMGRCLLIIEAHTGRLLQKITGDDGNDGFLFPIVGSPTVYPNDGTAVEQIYVGDLVGQLFGSI